MPLEGKRLPNSNRKEFIPKVTGLLRGPFQQQMLQRQEKFFSLSLSQWIRFRESPSLKATNSQIAILSSKISIQFLILNLKIAEIEKTSGRWTTAPDIIPDISRPVWFACQSNQYFFNFPTAVQQKLPFERLSQN